jgi:hypothetical protein
MSLSEKAEFQEFLRTSIIHPADGIKRNGHADDVFSGFYSHDNADKIIAWLNKKGATEGHQPILETASCP